MQKIYTKKLQAFSIIELTIVLIVIGLMTSAVLVGAKLISEAKIRQLSTYLTETENAIYGFKMQYNYLPGDFPMASTQWTIAEINEKCRQDDNGNMKDFDQASASEINGNGSFFVENDASTPDAGVFWCHLVLAKFIKASETIVTSALKPNKSANFLPSGLIYNVSNAMYLVGSKTATVNYDSGNYLYIFGRNGSKHANPFVPANIHITARELAAIDSKLDDGKPGDGRIVMFVEDNHDGVKTACCAGISSGRCSPASTYTTADNVKNSCYIRYGSKLFN